jgi:lipopolysaccharide transport system ATP-binding protein
MNDIALRVENLSKQYRIGAKRPYSRFSELLSTMGQRAIRWPARLLRRGTEAHDVAIKSEDFWALKDISLDVKEGEVVGIIGRNGAGKSTLLKILSRITEPTAGRIGVCGRVGSLLEVGTGFHPELTGRENIYLNGAILGMDPKIVRKHFDEIVAFAELERFLDTPVKRYSSGMYVRLGFAVAAHLEPDVLIVDEVLAVGDAKFQKQCLAKMDQTAKSGRTVLFVSHNLAAVRRLCTRVCLIGSGQLQFSGTPADAIDQYLGLETRVANETQTELASYGNRYGSGDARIVWAQRLTQVDGSPLRTGDEFALQFEIASQGQVDMHVSAVCVADDGTRVLYVSSFDDLSGQAAVVSGACTVEFRVPEVPLMPGSYSWTIGLHSTSQDPIDVVEGVLHFEVLDHLETKRPFAITSRSGFCHPKSYWKAIPTP